MRDEVCDKYEKYFYEQLESNTEFKSQVDNLVELAKSRDLVLGCHCKPKRCHVDTIKNYIDKMLMDYYVGEF